MKFEQNNFDFRPGIRRSTGGLAGIAARLACRGDVGTAELSGQAPTTGVPATPGTPSTGFTLSNTNVTTAPNAATFSSRAVAEPAKNGDTSRVASPGVRASIVKPHQIAVAAHRASIVKADQIAVAAHPAASK